MVGDHLDDIICGKQANSTTILLKNDHNQQFVPEADFAVDRLDEIIGLLQTEFDLFT